MKILIFAPFFPPDPTGSSVFAGQQANELVLQGHEVLIVTNRPDRNAPIADPRSSTSSRANSVRVMRLPSIRVNLGKITWNYGIPVSLAGFLRRNVRAEIRDFNPDAVIIHSTLFDLSLLALQWCAKQKKKSVIIAHTALWHDSRIVNGLMRLYGRTLLRRLIKQSNSHVVCVDKWTFDNATSIFSAVRNTSTIPVSVELGTMSNGDPAKVREKHRLGNGPILLSLGHVVPLRDRLNLVRALPLLVAKYPDIKLVIVGMVKDTQFLDLAEALGVRHLIVLVGPVPHNEIPNYLAVADIESHDLDGRGLGITSVEAMDAGVPIVAWAQDDNYPQFSLRGYGESGFIDDGQPSTIFMAIDRLLSAKEYRSAVISSQFRLVRDIYSVESVTQQYLQLLSSNASTN
jgi:1,2-diacylglycerol 3-alpha-glucosyltransferase